MEDVLSQISSALVNLSSPEEIQHLVNKALSQKIPLVDIVEKGLRIGLEGVGAKYEAGEYFLAELLFAASIIDELMTNIRPLLEGGTIESRGRIVLGTVRGDMHDIGKNRAVVIGGNAVTKEFGQETGADGTALNAVEGVNLCKGIISK